MKIISALFLAGILAAVNFAQANNQTTKRTDAKLLEEAQMFDKTLIEALRKGDRAALEQMIADGFVFIHSTGALETRAEYIKNAAAGNLVLQHTEFERFDETWRVYEGSTVIHYARTIMRNKAANTENRLRNITVYVKIANGWQWVSGQSTKLPVRPKAAAIDVRLYDDYAGKYEINSERAFTVTKENDVLYGVTTGRMKSEMIPTSDTTFVLFNENNDPGFMEITIIRDAGGKASEVVLLLNRQEIWRAKKVK